MKDKINNAIRILQLAEKQSAQYNEPVEIAYSGGKDSDVLLQLAKEAQIDFTAIYKNTTIDPPGTLQHVKENNVKIVQPSITFFNLVKKKGFPSFRFRFCCEKLKEYKILNTACWGVRAEESPARRNRYGHGFEFCRMYKKNSVVHVFTPISDWTLDDIKKFIKSRNISLAPVYYEEGRINYKCRLGCMCCPLSNDRGLKYFKKYPTMLKAYLRAGKFFFDNHYVDNKKFNDVYELFLFRTFFKSSELYELTMKERNLFNTKINAKEFLQNYFKVQL